MKNTDKNSMIDNIFYVIIVVVILVAGSILLKFHELINFSWSMVIAISIVLIFVFSSIYHIKETFRKN